jgi:hypothetical protein
VQQTKTKQKQIDVIEAHDGRPARLCKSTDPTRMAHALSVVCIYAGGSVYLQTNDI